MPIHEGTRQIQALMAMKDSLSAMRSFEWILQPRRG
jgi:hypothetical protein